MGNRDELRATGERPEQNERQKSEKEGWEGGTEDQTGGVEAEID